MIIKPKKKLYLFLWASMALLFIVIFWLIFHLFLGPYHVLSGVGLVLSFVSIISIYIKSVLNYFLVELTGNELSVYQFGKCIGSSPLKKVKFSTDYTKTGKKEYKRILFEINQQKIVVSNFEHEGFEVFYAFLIHKRFLKVK
jgi:hypothetical protein